MIYQNVALIICFQLFLAEMCAGDQDTVVLFVVRRSKNKDLADDVESRRDFDERAVLNMRSRAMRVRTMREFKHKKDLMALGNHRRAFILHKKELDSFRGPQSKPRSAHKSINFRHYPSIANANRN